MSRSSTRVRSCLQVVVASAFVLLPTATSMAQQNVFSRDDSGTGNWDSGNLPWYYATWNNNQSRPDFGGRNHVFIGHNNFNFHSINSANWYQLGSLTIQASSTVTRTFTSGGGAGIALTSALNNQSAAQISFNTDLALDADVTLNNTGGTVSLNQNVYLNNNTLSVDGSGSVQVTGSMSGTGNLSKNGSSTLLISGFLQTYSGTTTVNGGTLHVSNNSGLANSSDLVVNGGTFKLEYAPSSFILSDTVDNVTLVAGSLTGVNGVLTGSAYDVRSGSISLSLAGTAALTKSTAGVVTVSSLNTYTGNTTIEAGTLSLATTGSIDNSPVIDVRSGATLDVSAVAGGFALKSGQTLKGNGTVAGNTTINGGASLSPGASPGKLSITGNLTLSNGATTTMEIAGSSVGSYDEIDLTGALTYDGTLSIPISGTYTAGTSFDLFDFASQGGSFDAITLSGSYSGSLINGGGGVWANTLGGLVFTFTSSNGVLSLSSVAIPEPLTAAGVILIAGRVLGRRARYSL